MSNNYRFSFPTTIHFGAGTRKMVASQLKDQGLKRPLIVTDKGLADLGFFKTFAVEIQRAGLDTAVFSGIWGNPVKSQVMNGVDTYRTHRADCIIGIGGGAALDVAKAIALMATHTGDLFDYEDTPQGKPIQNNIPYWVALPTTAGTGSEVGRSSVVSDDHTHIKKIIFSPYLLAKAVFADPELTVDLPAKMTAATGMDALTHLIEAYLAKGYHPLCDGIALEGIRIGSRALVKAVKSPKNIQARGDMLIASMMGAIAFQKGLGVVHSCAHALSTVTDMHHGTANAVMIDHALAFNVKAVPERFKTMCEVIGLKQKSPKAFLAWLKKLKTQVGMPQKLSKMGVKKEQIEALVKVAIADGCHASNPKAVTEKDFIKIFKGAL